MATSAACLFPRRDGFIANDASGGDHTVVIFTIALLVDLNGDGAVSATDLGLLLGARGASGGAAVLGALLGAWTS